MKIDEKRIRLKNREENKMKREKGKKIDKEISQKESEK